jgi:hypothetical protein
MIRNYDGVIVKIAPRLEGLDLNRNFPLEWAFESEQKGAGPYPTSEPEVRALSAMQEEVFGGGFAQEMADALLRRLGFGAGLELWVAKPTEIVSSGRLEPMRNRFAGSGAARRDWNGVGAGSTALTAAVDQRLLARG